MIHRYRTNPPEQNEISRRYAEFVVDKLTSGDDHDFIVNVVTQIEESFDIIYQFRKHTD